MSNTTRRYPRTLDEAFGGRSLEYSCAIERPLPSPRSALLPVAAVLVAVLAAAVIVAKVLA